MCVSVAVCVCVCVCVERDFDLHVGSAGVDMGASAVGQELRFNRHTEKVTAANHPHVHVHRHLSICTC